MEQNKCYTVYTIKPCEVSVPLEPLHTHKYQISTLSGKLDFKLYIAVPLRTGNNGYKLERHTVKAKGYGLNTGIHNVYKKEKGKT